MPRDAKQKSTRTRAGSSARTAPPAGRAPLPRQLLLAAALILVTFVAYIPALQAGFIWDDDSYVTENPVLLSANGLWRIWTELGATPQYYPLVFTFFWLEVRVWGFDPSGFHVVNVLLHGMNAVLFWIVLGRLNLPRPLRHGTLLAAAIFALHPVHVESVAWITERKNVLSTFFYLAAALAYWRFQPLEPTISLQRNWRWWAISCALFLAALLSKTVTCTFPAAILVLIWWRHGRLAWRDVLPTIPMFGLGIAMGLLTAWMEREHVWGGHVQYDYSMLERAMVAGRAAWFYALSLLGPFNLTFIYPRWTIDSDSLLQWSFPFAALALPAVLWLLRNRLGRGPLASALLFGGTLFPALGFFPVYPFQFSFVADHFQYLASLWFIALVAAALAGLLSAAPRWMAFAAPALLLVSLAWLTFQQARIYESPLTLWTHTLRRNPSAWIAHNNLAVHFQGTGDAQRARDHAAAAIELRPDYPEAYINLGVALEELGELEQAIAAYRRAIELGPRYSQAHLNLAAALGKRREFASAEATYRAAIESMPDAAMLHHNYAAFLLGQGRLDEALASSRRAVGLNPSDADSHGLHGVILAALGRRDEAIAELRESLRLNPHHPLSRQALAELLHR